MSEQPEALRLANALDRPVFTDDMRGAARELRRLHSVNAELLEALQRLSAQAERLRLPGQTPSDAEMNAKAVISRALGQ